MGLGKKLNPIWRGIRKLRDTVLGNPELAGVTLENIVKTGEEIAAFAKTLEDPARAQLNAIFERNLGFSIFEVKL